MTQGKEEEEVEEERMLLLLIFCVQNVMVISSWLQKEIAQIFWFIKIVWKWSYF